MWLYSHVVVNKQHYVENNLKQLISKGNALFFSVLNNACYGVVFIIDCHAMLHLKRIMFVCRKDQ